jgi:hypothetical protein
MAKIDPLVKDFLAQKKIAVVGVSDKRETGCNAAYHRFKQAGNTPSACPAPPCPASITPLRSTELKKVNTVNDFGGVAAKIINRYNLSCYKRSRRSL